ncbi:MAG: Flp family type IVb pilin [Alphaproteobacteria bacterium]|nr:MAG: Flp family type IVb pilin [Alphaproteobacteria bacterium]
MNRFWKMIRETRGATAIEYSLIIGLIACAMLVGLSKLASAKDGLWNTVQGTAENSM